MPPAAMSSTQADGADGANGTETAKAIQELLNICAENNVQIPPDIRDALTLHASKQAEDEKLGNGRYPRSAQAGLQSSMLEVCIEENNRNSIEFEESDLVKGVRRLLDATGLSLLEWELRVKGASYTIIDEVYEHEAVEQHETVEAPLGGSDDRSGKSISRDRNEGVYQSISSDRQGSGGMYAPRSHSNLAVDPEDNEESPPKAFKPHIPTVASVGCVDQFLNRLKYWKQSGKFPRKKPKELILLKDVNLRIHTGKMYLVLGAPGAGKTTLLKAMSGLLRQDKSHIVGGDYAINGIESNSKEYYWENLIGYVDQIDRHHESLTVKETVDYAWFCRQGGTHRKIRMTDSMPADNPLLDEEIVKLDKDHWLTNAILEGLGLARVADTFVGNDVNVRGVSGGERKRVTVAEILAFGIPFLCMDEISTGLDAATTYDIVDLMAKTSRLYNFVRIVSLLQPPPETVALFDELILVDKGQILYSGPVSEVVSHFESLGYAQPERMDMADWLQSLPTPDGNKFLTKDKDGKTRNKHLTSQEFVEAFNMSKKGRALTESLEKPLAEEVSSIPKDPQFTQKYRNSWYTSLWLCTKHEFLVWRRNRQQILFRIAQCVIMALIVGTVFWQVQDTPSAIFGVVYQSLFFISLGGMTAIMPQIDCRGVFYKHQDAHMFPTWTFVLGRSLANFPASIIDALTYGVIVFFFTGMAYDAAKFFVFLLLVLMSAYCTLLVYSVFSASMPDSTSAMTVAVVLLIMMTIFSGFAVQPDVIPNYWIWAYWINYFAWMLRSLVLNQFLGGGYNEPSGIDGYTVGETILIQFGFEFNGEPYEYVWVWYGVAFVIGIYFVAMTANTACYNHIRYHTGQSLTSQADLDDEATPDGVQSYDLPFQKVNLTFKDIRYTVNMSTSRDTIDLLKGISGFFEAGKVTALMGSSGAGKTTLMDVLTLRKSSGTVSGEVRLNGHLQESNSFRRCAGYVEQFDVQTAQLTIRETVEFSSKMRIDRSAGDVTEETITKFVDKTLGMLELSAIQHFLVGSDISGGLSFEQHKRLSIAVELASNPSIIFLDEPTSGLDARAASIVMRGLMRIAKSGRAVCATIHQPSVAIFNSFDCLLLLKRGGETVFFGDLGKESSLLIEYLERFDTTPKIRAGENPATWMLTTIGGGTSGKKIDMDYAKAYSNSHLLEKSLERIDELDSMATDENNILFPTKYATKLWFQSRKVLARTMKVYWRSPSYNRSRLIVSTLIALIFGSVFASQRVPTNESEMNSRITSVYISAIFLGTVAFMTVLSFFEKERNMFYRHKAALMYDHNAINLSYMIAEIPFVVLSSMLFCICFYFPLGFKPAAGAFFLFYFFSAINVALWTYLGQTCISLFRDAVSANGFGSVLLGLSTIFAGILIRPQDMNSFWLFMYWAMPLHYVIEGLTVSQFADYDQAILASPGSPFYKSLVLKGDCVEGDDTCYGPADQWFYVSFGGWWVQENLPWNALYLICFCILTKLVGYIALWKLTYLSK